MTLFKKVKRKIWKIFFKNARLSYAQSGEDMILDTIFCNVKNGFYIDIGANNPWVQSNTYFFYRKGWRGINIDALPGMKISFDKHRPRDINVEAAIDNDEKELHYYMFKSSFYNTFSQNDAEKIKQHSPLIGMKTIRTTSLSNILNQYNVENIDFLSCDVEGMDINVFKSNDWAKYRPKIIITEYFYNGIDKISQDAVYQYLAEQKYIYFCNSATNAFYIDTAYQNERFKR